MDEYANAGEHGINGFVSMLAQIADRFTFTLEEHGEGVAFLFDGTFGVRFVPDPDGHTRMLNAQFPSAEIAQQAFDSLERVHAQAAAAQWN